ncbi:MAG: hypothetical protein Q8P15_01745 [Nanoarchaeota archaeon]|nr:hypothetical protein [Nanoarchaeota archaeon]
MIERTYTKAELKDKISRYNKLVVGSLIVALCGGGIVVSPQFREFPKKPPIVIEYDKANDTLTRLRFEYAEIKNPTFEYKNNELQSILNQDTVRISKLEKAINLVQADISKFEENSEYASYQEKVMKSSKENKLLYFGGILIYLLGASGAIIFGPKHTKYKKQLENISK